MKHLQIFIVSFLITLSSCGQSAVDKKKSAKTLWLDGKRNEAFHIYSDLATLDDAEAQYMLGICYKNGQGVGKNDSLSKKWFLASAKQKYPEAQQEMALLTYNKSDNYKESFLWTKSCAELGYPPCIQSIAGYYESGKGVEKNLDSMLRWTKQLALSERVAFNQDFINPIISARLRLAFLYYQDQGIKQDLIQSYLWLLLFNKIKDQASMWDREKALELAKLINSKITAEQKLKAETEATDF